MLSGLLGLLFLLFLGVLIALAGYVAITSWEMCRPPRHAAGWALARKRPTDPGALDLPFESWQLDLRDGTSLPVWDIPANEPSNQSDVPTLVFLHGWGHSRIHSLERLASILNSDGGADARTFRTILLDLRGHGDAGPGGSTLGERDVEDLCTLIEQLGEPGVVLIGHSLGGVVAIHAATRTPEMVHGVVALAPYDRLRTPIDGTLRARSLPSGVFADLIARLASSSKHCRSDSRDSARLMTQPLHVIIGEDDRICSVSIARSIAEAAPHGDFALLENCAHGNHHECAPQIIHRSIRSMMASTSNEKACSPTGEHASSDPSG